MKHCAIVGLLSLFGAAVSAAADSDPEVWDYARSCFERLELAASDLTGPFDCTQGKRLMTELEGKVQDLDRCTGEGCAADLPEKCDYGTWLDYKCYGHSYIQIVPTPSNPKVKAALLCRHKTRWELGAAPLLDPDGNLKSGFDDIAMIMHNSQNGETCWFQSNLGDDTHPVHLDGLSVPSPRGVRNHDFWKRPTDTFSDKCIQCHDSGPWMNSRWMNNVIGEELAGNRIDPLKGPYQSSEPPFDSWPKPVFVELVDDNTCTECHHIAAANPSENFHTCDEWIRRATTWPHPKASLKGHSVEVVYWMPEGHGLTTREAWNGEYFSKVDRLITCCKAAGAKPNDPNSWPPGCQVECPMPRADDGSCPATP